MLAMTRKEYVEQSKEHALWLLNVGRAREAVASMMVDMRISANFGVPPEIHAIGICAAAADDASGVRAYIEGFN
ncbi:hypothetical protein [Bradyrhizobium sp. SUTN9-2]|uniref:hypothetical protein n=1 Tax=Bradyrhizobium sp. SUTN9-2 TaxID=1167456 RepID=UPI0011B2304D|nr:hypothetical protein [Bradyrhizobium sp. SUTN9-2]